MMSAFQLNHHRRDDSLCIHLSGQLRVDRVLHLAEFLHEAKREPLRRIIVDLQELSGMDETGFSYLKATQIHFSRLGIPFIPVRFHREVIERLVLNSPDLDIAEQWTALCSAQ